MTAVVQTQVRSPDRKHHRVVVTKHGGPDVLQTIEEDVPEPGTGEVRVKVEAAGVSAYDLMGRQSGLLPGSPKVPFTPGEDIVGLVDKLGGGVSSFELGQRVAGFTLEEGGGYAEFVCQPASQLVPVPSGVDPAEAVCLVVNYLTAYLAMHQTAKVQSGERILVHGAAGGVGSALLQLGKLAELEMYGTASKYNHETVSALGATPIDYRSEDFVQRIRSLTGDGVDVVFDPIGGGRQVWRSHKALRQGGRLVWFGMAATKNRGMWVIPSTLVAMGLLALIPRGRQVPFMPDLGTATEQDGSWYHDTLAELFDLCAAGRLKPVIAERFPLLEAARAHERLEQGRYAGKVVLVSGNSSRQGVNAPR